MWEPSLAEGEEVILRRQSCFSITCATWKPGFLYLTNRRLIFSQPSRAIFATSLDKVTDVKILRGKFILGLRRRLLRVLYKSARRDKTLQVWFATNNPEEWEKAIMKAKASYMDEKRREPLVDVFDKKDHYEVVAELPGVQRLDEVKLRVVDGKLTMSVNTPSRKYRKEVELPTPVKAEKLSVKSKKNVLEIKLEKS